MADLEAQFHQEMLGIYEAARTVGYQASYFLQMVSERGGLDAAKRLVAASRPSEGFTKLWELKRLDLSVEALVLRAPWCTLFEAQELATARKRLAAYGASVP